MKILFDHQIFIYQKFGGISRYFHEIMKINGVHAEVSSIPLDLFIPKYESPPPIEKHDLISRGTRFFKRKAGLSEQNSVELDEQTTGGITPREVSEILQRAEFDILHPTYYDTYFLELTKKPFVLTVYDMIHEIYKEYFSLSDPISRNKLLLCQKANQIITISQTTKNDLLDIFDLPEEKVHVIPLASDFDKLIPVNPDKTSDIKKYILYVGSRYIYKNFYFTVLALSDIIKSNNNLQILCTGNPFTNEELKFFDDLGILNRVKHVSPKNDNELAWLYKNADLFIFPSLYEGFGFPLLEAFALNCPVIASNGGSLPEVGGNAVLYFDPKSKFEIQEAATKVLYNSTIRNEQIQKGKIQFQKFSWERCRAETLKVYEKVS